MLPRLAVFATLLFLCRSTSTGVSDDHVALFVFGDSVFDNGMTLFGGDDDGGASRWPYGETYFKHPAGRFSDGRVIPDFIAQFAKLPFVKPYLLPGLNNYANGVNFASASACVLVENRPFSIGLKIQVNYFLQVVQKLQQQMGAAKANKMLSRAVYLFDIGGNDYVTLLENNISKTVLSPSYKEQYINMVLGNLTNHILTIYNQGARKFAFQNVAPIGCLPLVKCMVGFDGTCVPEALELAKMHNEEFLAIADKLQSQLHGFKYIVYDFYTALYSRVVNATSYGFKDGQRGCCGSGPFNGQFTCSQEDGNFSICSNPSEYVFFDSAHPTDKANSQFSMELWSGGPNIVAPYNLKRLFHMDDDDGQFLGFYSSL